MNQLQQKDPHRRITFVCRDRGGMAVQRIHSCTEAVPLFIGTCFAQHSLSTFRVPGILLKTEKANINKI